MNTIAIKTERLKECREQLGISKNEAAKRIGVSQPAYLRYESGARKPSIQVIKEIARVFHTSVDYLTGNTNNNTLDYLTISKDTDPLLIEVINKYMSLNLSQRKNLLLYLNKLK